MQCTSMLAKSGANLDGKRDILERRFAILGVRLAHALDDKRAVCRILVVEDALALCRDILVLGLQGGAMFWQLTMAIATGRTRLLRPPCCRWRGAHGRSSIPSNSVSQMRLG